MIETSVEARTYLRSWEGSALMCGVSTECPNTAPSVPEGNQNARVSISKYTDTVVFFYFYALNILLRMGKLKIGLLLLLLSCFSCVRLCTTNKKRKPGKRVQGREGPKGANLSPTISCCSVAKSCLTLCSPTVLTPFKMISFIKVQTE